jgi:hypothetical protein
MYADIGDLPRLFTSSLQELDDMRKCEYSSETVRDMLADLCRGSMLIGLYSVEMNRAKSIMWSWE